MEEREFLEILTACIRAREEATEWRRRAEEFLKEIASARGEALERA